MSSNHTPGKWFVSKDERKSTQPKFVLQVWSDGHCVANIGHPIAPDWAIEEAEANARLIAAAPGLLELCEDAVTEIAAWHDSIDTLEHRRIEQPDIDLYFRLKDAIAKARGSE